MPAIYDQSAAGYVSSGWRFRFVAATLKVPAPQAIKGDNGPAGVSLSDSTHPAALLIQTGGGAGGITYDNGFGHGTVPLAPRAGNILRVSVYRDQAGDRDVFAVTNTSTGRTWTAPVATPAGIVYRQASATASLDNATAGAPLNAVRLWSFRSVRVTSYSGIAGRDRAAGRGPRGGTAQAPAALRRKLARHGPVRDGGRRLAGRPGRAH